MAHYLLGSPNERGERMTRSQNIHGVTKVSLSSDIFGGSKAITLILTGDGDQEEKITLFLSDDYKVEGDFNPDWEDVIPYVSK